MSPRNSIYVLGTIWWPIGAPAARRYDLSAYDLDNMRNDFGLIEREDIEGWLCTHSGDFGSITDYAAWIEGQDVEWADLESAFTYHDCLYPDED